MTRTLDIDALQLSKF